MLDSLRSAEVELPTHEQLISLTHYLLYGWRETIPHPTQDQMSAGAQGNTGHMRAFPSSHGFSKTGIRDSGR
jgi:hypothetical protein